MIRRGSCPAASVPPFSVFPSKPSCFCFLSTCFLEPHSVSPLLPAAFSCYWDHSSSLPSASSEKGKMVTGATALVTGVCGLLNEVLCGNEEH